MIDIISYDAAKTKNKKINNTYILSLDNLKIYRLKFHLFEICRYLLLLPIANTNISHTRFINLIIILLNYILLCKIHFCICFSRWSINVECFYLFFIHLLFGNALDVYTEIFLYILWT